MKMVMAVVPRDQASRVLESLIQAGHTATFCESRSGMLRQAQQMFFIAVKAEDLTEVLNLIRDNYRGRVKVESGSLAFGSATEVGSAAIFVWDLESFETY